LHMGLADEMGLGKAEGKVEGKVSWEGIGEE
jgi:hypothetical protein